MILRGEGELALEPPPRCGLLDLTGVGGILVDCEKGFCRTLRRS
jgi:hypothetical protein